MGEGGYIMNDATLPQLLTPAGDAGLKISVPKRPPLAGAGVLFNALIGTPAGSTPTAPGKADGFFPFGWWHQVCS